MVGVVGEEEPDNEPDEDDEKGFGSEGKEKFWCDG